MLKKLRNCLILRIRGVPAKGEKLSPAKIYKTTMPVPVSMEKWESGEWSKVINNTNYEKEI